MKMLRKNLLFLFAVLSICNAQMRKLNPNGEFYRAAVYELKQYNDDTSSGSEIISKNLDKYEEAARLAAMNNVDIIVLPEKGLYPMKMDNGTWFLNYGENVPDGSEEANPCNEEKYSDSPILRKLSCIAKDHNLYVAGDLIDLKKCKVHKNCKSRKNRNSCVAKKQDCPSTSLFYFNALVVFNRKGDLIVRYYKRHPFVLSDQDITTPKYKQPGYFDTEFGSFATEIGLDMLFRDPVADIEKRPMVTGISLANWWFDHTPFYYFGVPVQHSFSLANNVTVLSSDVHNPGVGSLGSGIYLPGKGAAVYSYNPDGKSKLLISNVPIDSEEPLDMESLNTKFFYMEDGGTFSELNGEEPREFKEQCGVNVLGMNPNSFTDYRCQQTKVDQYTFVKLNKTKDQINICSNNFCCSLEYQAESMDETFYFAVSGHRLNFYDVNWFGVQSCFLSRCEPVDGKPCRNFLLKSNTKFNSIKISGSFDTKYVYPHVLDSELRLTDSNEWHFDGNSQLSYQNLKGKYILHADLYGRIYQKDGPIHQ